MEQDRAKKWLYWAGTIALLVFAYAAFSYANSYSRMIDPGSSRSFAVTGVGKATAQNDIAQFTYSVVIEGGKDIAQIKKQSNDKTEKIQQFLKQQGVADKDVETVSYNLSPRYQYYSCSGASAVPCRPSEIVGYTLSQTDSIKIRDLSKVDRIVSGVVDAGANNVSQLTFTVDNPESLRTEAKAAAIKQAISQAKAMAKEAGFGIGRIISIDDNSVPAPYMMTGLESAKVGLGGGIAQDANLNPGSNEVTSNVVVRFEIR